MPIRIASVPFYWSFEQRRQMKWVKTTNLVLVMGGSAVTAAAILVSSSRASALLSLSGFPSEILRLDLDLESGSDAWWGGRTTWGGGRRATGGPAPSPAAQFRPTGASDCQPAENLGSVDGQTPVAGGGKVAASLAMLLLLRLHHAFSSHQSATAASNQKDTTVSTPF